MEKVNYQKLALQLAAEMIRAGEKGNAVDLDFTFHQMKLTPRQRTSATNKLLKLADNLEARSAKMSDPSAESKSASGEDGSGEEP